MLVEPLMMISYLFFILEEILIPNDKKMVFTSPSYLQRPKNGIKINFQNLLVKYANIIFLVKYSDKLHQQENIICIIYTVTFT